MVEQAQFKWEVTLADDSVIKEVDGTRFNLGWESAGVIKLFTIKEVGDGKHYSVNLETGEFDMNGQTEIPSGLGGGSLGEYAFRFFRRHVVRIDTDGTKLGDRVAYYLGYVKGSTEKLLKFQPEIGMIAEICEYAER